MKYNVVDYYGVFVNEVELDTPPNLDDILTIGYRCNNVKLHDFFITHIDGDTIYVD